MDLMECKKMEDYSEDCVPLARNKLFDVQNKLKQAEQDVIAAKTAVESMLAKFEPDIEKNESDIKVELVKKAMAKVEQTESEVNTAEANLQVAIEKLNAKSISIENNEKRAQALVDHALSRWDANHVNAGCKASPSDIGECKKMLDNAVIFRSTAATEKAQKVDTENDALKAKNDLALMKTKLIAAEEQKINTDSLVTKLKMAEDNLLTLQEEERNLEKLIKKLVKLEVKMNLDSASERIEIVHENKYDQKQLEMQGSTEVTEQVHLSGHHHHEHFNVG